MLCGGSKLPYDGVAEDKVMWYYPERSLKEIYQSEYVDVCNVHPEYFFSFVMCTLFIISFYPLSEHWLEYALPIWTAIVSFLHTKFISNVLCMHFVFLQVKSMILEGSTPPVSMETPLVYSKSHDLYVLLHYLWSMSVFMVLWRIFTPFGSYFPFLLYRQANASLLANEPTVSPHVLSHRDWTSERSAGSIVIIRNVISVRKLSVGSV